MKRILKTKHKLIGFIGIILVLDLVLVGALMKPVNADRKTEDYDAAAEISTSLNVAAMQAKLTVEDESKAVIKSGTDQDPGNREVAGYSGDFGRSDFCPRNYLQLVSSGIFI